MNGRFLRSVFALSLIIICSVAMLQYAALPDRMFGTNWLRPLMALVLFIEMARHIWRGRERTGV